MLQQPRKWAYVPRASAFSPKKSASGASALHIKTSGVAETAPGVASHAAEHLRSASPARQGTRPANRSKSPQRQLGTATTTSRVTDLDDTSGALSPLKQIRDEFRIAIEDAKKEDGTFSTEEEKEITEVGNGRKNQEKPEAIKIALTSKLLQSNLSQDKSACELTFSFLDSVDPLFYKEEEATTEQAIVPVVPVEQIREYQLVVKNLRKLDLSGNNLRKIENLEPLVQLRELSLHSCEIEKMENLEHFQFLERLELQYNKIAKVQNLENLKSLTFLNLDKNKIDTKGLLATPATANIGAASGATAFNGAAQSSLPPSNASSAAQTPVSASSSRLVGSRPGSGVSSVFSSAAGSVNLLSSFTRKGQKLQLSQLDTVSEAGEQLLAQQESTGSSFGKSSRTSRAGYNAATGRQGGNRARSVFPPSLKELHLSHNRIANLSTSLQWLPKLEVLCLNHNRIGSILLSSAGSRGEDQGESVASSVCPTPLSTARSGRSSSHSSSAAVSFSSRASESTTLQRPSISELALSKTFVPLHKALGNLSALKELELDFNQIDNLSFLFTKKTPGELGVVLTGNSTGTNSAEIMNRTSGTGRPVDLTQGSLGAQSFSKGANKTSSVNTNSLSNEPVRVPTMPRLMTLSLVQNRITSLSTSPSSGSATSSSSSADPQSSKKPPPPSEQAGATHNQATLPELRELFLNNNGIRALFPEQSDDGRFADTARSSANELSGTCNTQVFTGLEALDLAGNPLVGPTAKVVSQIAENFGETLAELHMNVVKDEAERAEQQREGEDDPRNADQKTTGTEPELKNAATSDPAEPVDGDDHPSEQLQETGEIRKEQEKDAEEPEFLEVIKQGSKFKCLAFLNDEPVPIAWKNATTGNGANKSPSKARQGMSHELDAEFLLKLEDVLVDGAAADQADWDNQPDADTEGTANAEDQNAATTVNTRQHVNIKTADDLENTLKKKSLILQTNNKQLQLLEAHDKSTAVEKLSHHTGTNKRRFFKEPELLNWEQEQLQLVEQFQQGASKLLDESKAQLEKFTRAIQKHEDCIKREEMLHGEKVQEEIEAQKREEFLTLDTILEQEESEMDKLADEEFKKWQTELGGVLRGGEEEAVLRRPERLALNLNLHGDLLEPSLAEELEKIRRSPFKKRSMSTISEEAS
ncbi:unnamed protein product [Amoebophrya sp. A120]|nr:unnamed protein product [Amoebophrya sp. A120]|eukprot:GSA120T00004109001.1